MHPSFKDLDLITPLAQALEEQKYTAPTDIQLQAIPVILRGSDLVACAQTGTGKSAAFCLPLLQQLHIDKTDNGHTGIRALILAPTRELATQIDESLAAYGRHTCLNHTAIFGGIPRKVQIDHLSRDIDVLVATPGRLLDLVDKGIISLERITHFVLDEADTMLNLGFQKEVESVITLLPKQRQTLLFSATMPYEITTLANAILQNPVHIKTTPTVSASANVSQQLYWVDAHDKPNLLLHLLRLAPIESAFIFVATKQNADKIAAFLVGAGHNAEAIHSDRTQKERKEALERFKNREVKLLVATDVVARGIDVDKVSHVFNLELPQEADNYVHRIGRTGRANHQGTAITFCDIAEMSKLRTIEKLIKQSLPTVDGHPFMNMALRKKLFDAQTKTGKSTAVKKSAKRRR